ncbi:MULTISPECIES: RNA methyltransferase [Mesorhizobium]|uniref:TrmH family RNA methyltransferase n=7 Tax=Phyllobacteriaceae TaxID=69277 RepID=UPI001F2DDEE1|nr:MULTISPECIES: RNA methyltransferase [Mesorhizobium]MCF6126950.1 RNA methyltransferase [Mesorhizobium ciceri]
MHEHFDRRFDPAVCHLHFDSLGLAIRSRQYATSAQAYENQRQFTVPGPCVSSIIYLMRLPDVAAIESPRALDSDAPLVRTSLMETLEAQKPRVSVRKRAAAVKSFRCKNLVAVVEDPNDIRNIGTVIRNANALGVERVYIVDPRKALPDDWQQMRQRKSLSETSVSAVKWTFVKRFDSTDACLSHLEKHGFVSVVTSPHIMGKTSVFLHEGDYTQHTKLAVWFGNEKRGISTLAVERSEMCVAIPMFGMIESLNLGTSSGIVLYEIAKQRREYQSKYRRGSRKGKRAEPLPTVMRREIGGFASSETEGQT